MLHHYLEFIDEESVAEAEKWSQDLSARYSELEAGTFTGNSASGASSTCRGLSSKGGSENSKLSIPILFPSF